MNKNYFKVAIRNLIRNKGYTFINLSGLAVGAAACILIMLFVRSEWSYDKFNSKADRLYRVWLEEKESADKIFTETVTPLPLGPSMVNSIPEIESTCRVYSFAANMKADKETSISESATIVDNSFFSLFDFSLEEGNSQKPFPSANSIILTRRIAEKYFGKSSPIGKVLQLQLGNEYVSFTVSGVVNKVPEESSVQFDMLIPFDNAHYLWNERQLKAWHQIFPETYALLKSKSNPESFEIKFDAFAKEVLGNNYKKGTYNLHLQPITDIHLNNNLPEGIQRVSSPVYTYVLSTIGILIMLIACFNFITLSIGRSTSRAMEVGVRKVLGADRRQLALQFWTETFLFSVGAMLLGVFLSILFIGPFNTLFQKHLTFSVTPFTLSFFIFLTACIALIAGSYPAFVLSGFSPTEVFKGKSKSAGKKGRLRHTLVAGQFVASISLITCTIVVGRQMDYIEHKDLGYRKDQVVVVQTNKPDKEGKNLAELFKNELRKIPLVKSASVSLYTFAEPSWIEIGYTDKDNKFRQLRANIVDADFLKTMNVQLVAGRNFSPDKSDASTGFIVNEALVKEYGWSNPIGQRLPGKFDAVVIGVVKDFNYESLHSKVQPLVLATNEDPVNKGVEDVNISSPPEARISVLMQGGNISENIALLKQAWTRIEKVQAFDYKFLDETLAAQYTREQRVNKIILLASGLSIFIACMGLFGLATLIVNRRVKEIGIRKILGAHYTSIVALISKDFVVVVFISALISFPIALYAMNKWLDDFAYRVEVSWWIFVLSAIIALVITLCTVGLQALRATFVNPVISLRTE
ncbi:MAG: ABC transporter permease [Bacteroidota bacterium]